MPDGTDPKKFKKAVVNPSTSKPADINTTKSITDQFDFTRGYVNSPMYNQRLAKMINTERGLPGTVAANGNFNSELLSQFKPSQPLDYIVGGIVNRNNQNLDTVAGNIKVGDINLGKNVAGGYDSSYNDVRFNSKLLGQNPTVPGHEFSHAANDGVQPYSDSFKSKYVDKYMIPASNSMYEPEVQKPTEVKARLDAIRGLASKKGIYDAGKETFSKEHLDKLKEDPEFKNDFNFKQLRDQLQSDYKDNGFIWLMNNIAMKDDKPEINPTAAWS